MVKKTPFNVGIETDSGSRHQTQVDDVATAGDGEAFLAHFERFELSGGGYVNVTRLDVQEPLEIEADSPEDQPLVCTMCVVEGEATVEFPNGNTGRLDPQNGLAFVVHKVGAKFILPKMQRARSLGITVPPATFLKYLSGDIPEAFRPVADANWQVGVGIPFKVSEALHTILSATIDSDLTGDRRRLQLEGAALQLLAMQAEAIENEETQSRFGLTRSERTAVEHARTRLLSDLKEPPALRALADAVGLTERRLNQGLKALFGQTTSGMLRDARMERARDLLQQGDMAIKEVAYEVGYGHVTNFTNAFTKRFGRSPHAYREGRLTLADPAIAPRDK